MTARWRPGSSVVLIAAAGCFAACSAEQDPVEREEEIAANDVWHAAKLRGVAFRAIGQEPGWLLEITNGEEILLVTDYGSNRQSLPFVAPEISDSDIRTQFVLDEHGITIEIRGERCADVMSGEEFDFAVTVFQADKEFHGCGRGLF